jgi:hypothetical protein
MARLGWHGAGIFEQDQSPAPRAAGRIPDPGRANRNPVGQLQGLQSRSIRIDCKDRSSITEMFDKMHSSQPLAQETLMREVLPLIKASDQRYRKFQQVHARPASPGEVIISLTDDGEETTNTADAGDMVVRNQTQAQEEYIIGGARFLERYSMVRPVDGAWKLYEPRGEVLGIEITRELAAEFGVGQQFTIVAPWGTEQTARVGDMFVSPLPDLDEIYRIARKEFEETYRLN